VSGALLGDESTSKGSGQSTNTPVSMTPSAFVGLQPGVASGLSNMFSGGPVYSGPQSVGAPLSTAPTNVSPSTFSAPISANENSILSNIMGFNNANGGVNPAVGSYLSTVLNPSYAGNIAQSPAVQQAISSAIAPMESTFQNVTMPQLKGNFVANGAVLNGPGQTNGGQPGMNPASGGGSSAFDKAAAIAQTGLAQAEGQTAGGIVNNAMSNAMQQQSQGATQAQTLSTTQVNNLVTSLQAEALPRLIQQYGLDQGLQEFNNRVQTMLEALGIGAQISGPDVAESGQSTQSTNSQSGSGFMGGINQMVGLFGG